MLYEALLEGIILFLILFLISKKNFTTGILSGYFLLLYGIFRFIIEFVRLPDAHIGYIYSDWVTMGQLLTVPMLVIGIMLINRKST
jgi:phosphatidylglycerol:prolipoprotein diacylglycerol transferase